MQMDRAEVSGVTSGSVVTPSIGPAGFTGAVVSNGTGSVNFTRRRRKWGLLPELLREHNNAYYKFTGSTIGNIFNVNQGQITFNLTSRYSFAQRTASASAPRIRSTCGTATGSHLFYFLTQVSGGLSVFQLRHRRNGAILLCSRARRTRRSAAE